MSFWSYVLPTATLGALALQGYSAYQYGKLVDRLVQLAQEAAAANLAAQAAYNQLLQEQTWPAYQAYTEAAQAYPGAVQAAFGEYLTDLMERGEAVQQLMRRELESQWPIPAPVERVTVPEVPEAYRAFAFAAPSGEFFRQMPTEVLAALQRAVSADAAARGYSGGAFAAALGEGMAPVYLQALETETRARQGAAQTVQEYDRLRLLAEDQFQRALRAREESIARRLAFQMGLESLPLELRLKAGPEPVVPPIPPVIPAQPAMVNVGLPTIAPPGGMGDLGQALGWLWRWSQPAPPSQPTPTAWATAPPGRIPETSPHILFTLAPTTSLALAQQPGREWWRLSRTLPPWSESWLA